MWRLDYGNGPIILNADCGDADRSTCSTMTALGFVTATASGVSRNLVKNTAWSHSRGGPPSLAPDSRSVDHCCRVGYRHQSVTQAHSGVSQAETNHGVGQRSPPATLTPPLVVDVPAGSAWRRARVTPPPWPARTWFSRPCPSGARGGGPLLRQRFRVPLRRPPRRPRPRCARRGGRRAAVRQRWATLRRGQGWRAGEGPARVARDAAVLDAVHGALVKVGTLRGVVHYCERLVRGRPAEHAHALDWRVKSPRCPCAHARPRNAAHASNGGGATSHATNRPPSAIA